MDNKKTFEEKLEDLKKVSEDSALDTSIISAESIDQMIKANELKYIEAVLNVAEENVIVADNIKDFLAYSEEIQKEALEEYPKALADQKYWEKPGVNKDLIKPIIILDNIDRKKNEAKVKGWNVTYRARLISRLQDFKKSLNA